MLGASEDAAAEDAVAEDAIEDMGDQEPIVASDEETMDTGRDVRYKTVVTAREFAAFRMQQRVSPDDWVVRQGRLFQEWLVREAERLCGDTCLVVVCGVVRIMYGSLNWLLACVCLGVSCLQGSCVPQKIVFFTQRKRVCERTLTVDCALSSYGLLLYRVCCKDANLCLFCCMQVISWVYGLECAFC